MKRILFIFLFVLATTATVARGATIAVSADDKPFVLSLSGGGARGLAHIGVLKCLEEYGIVPDTVIGVSMGAVVAALYAGGYSADEIYQALKPIANPNYFYSSLAQNKYSRNKRSRGIFSVTLDDNLSPVFQSSVVSEQFLDNLISSKILAPQLRSGGDFDKLPIPLRIITTDVSNAKTVLHKSGDILQLVKASSAVPGFMLPVKIGEDWHIDGGLKANIPLLDTIKREDEFLVVVDVTSKEEKKEKIHSIVDALTMSITIGMREAEDKNSTLADFVISPQFDRQIKNTDFYLFEYAVAAGYKAAKEVLQKTSAFDAYKEARTVATTTEDDLIYVGNISVEGLNARKERYLNMILNAYIGETVSAAELSSVAKYLNGSEVFDGFYFTGAGDSLVAKVKKKPKMSIDLGFRFDNNNLSEVMAAPAYNDILDIGLSVVGDFHIGYLRKKVLGGLLWDIPTRRKVNLSFYADGKMMSQRFVMREIDDTTDVFRPTVHYSESDISKNGADFMTELGFANNLSLFAGFRNERYRLRTSNNADIFLDLNPDENRLEMFFTGIGSDYRDDGYFPTKGGMQNFQLWTSDKLFGSQNSFVAINSFATFIIPTGANGAIIPSIYYAYASEQLPTAVRHHISSARNGDFVMPSVPFAGLHGIDLFADNFFVSELCLRYQVMKKYPLYALLYIDYGNLYNYDESGKLNMDFVYNAPIGIETELALQTLVGPIRFSWSRIIFGEFAGYPELKKKNVFKFSAGFDF